MHLSLMLNQHCFHLMKIESVEIVYLNGYFCVCNNVRMLNSSWTDWFVSTGLH